MESNSCCAGTILQPEGNTEDVPTLVSESATSKDILNLIAKTQFGP